MFSKGLALAVGAAVAGATQLAAAAPDSHAVVKAVQGAALVARGSEIVSVTEGMDLHPLNRIFVLESSEATIAFADGCERTVGAHAMLTVDDSGTCPAASAVERGATSLAEGEGTSTQSSFAAAAALPPGGAGFAPIGGDPTTIGLTVLGVGVLGGVIWAATDDDDNNPPPVAQPPLSP